MPDVRKLLDEVSRMENEAVHKAITDAVRKHRSSHKRHPLEVTSDRIGDAIERYHGRLSGAERDTLSSARYILETLAEGQSDA